MERFRSPDSCQTIPLHEVSTTSPVELGDLLEEVLMDFRVTLRRYDIEFLYTPLARVPAEEHRVRRFFRLCLGRVVQFSRGGVVEVRVEGRPRRGGYDVVMTASRCRSEKLMIVGCFGEALPAWASGVM